MNDDKPIRTKYTYIKADEKIPGSKPVHFIFLSIERDLTGDECEQLAQEHFETHNKMTLPGEPLMVDLRPAFRKPLSEVTPHCWRGSK